VSADVGEENGTRAKKRQRAKPNDKKTRIPASRLEPPAAPESAHLSAPTTAPEETAAPTTVAPAESVAPLVTPHAARQAAAPARRVTHLPMVALAGVTILVVVALAFPHHPSAPGADDVPAVSQLEPQKQSADLVAPSPQPAGRPVAPIAAPVAASSTAAPRAVSEQSKKALMPSVDKNRAAESTKSGVSTAGVTRVAVVPAVPAVPAVPFRENAPTTLPGYEAIAPPAPASVSTGIGGITPVTITGCLEISVAGDEFRLIDTEGVDAPRSRSWRTGFLTKRSAPVALVEPPDRLALQTHVGRRVAATGLLTSHDLKLSALRDVGAACN